MKTRRLNAMDACARTVARGTALLALLYGATGFAAAQSVQPVPSVPSAPAVPSAPRTQLMPSAQPSQPQAFQVGEMQRIVTRHGAGPLLVNFWSAHCAPCLQELPLLKQLAERHRHWQLVLVSTDGPEQAPAVTAALRRHGIDPARTWLFAEANAPALRFDVDRRWAGELPRSYFFIDGRRVGAFSGQLDAARIEQLFAPASPGAPPPAANPTLNALKERTPR